MRCYLFASSRSLAVVALLALLNHGVSVGCEEPKKEVINVGVYYESLCGDSMRWIRDQLLPSYETLKNHIHLNFVPYGKATHWREAETGPWQFSCQHGSAECRGNMAQACAIDAIKNGEQAEKIQDLTVAVIGCAMSTRYPPTAVPQCAQKSGLSQETQENINKCIDGSLSKDLLAANGDKTAALNPRLTFVPTITINEVHDKEKQRDTLTNFFRLICDQLSETTRPAGCA